jgi:endonuclease YncB( thermonuclease family)
VSVTVGEGDGVTVALSTSVETDVRSAGIDASERGVGDPVLVSDGLGVTVTLAV